MASDYHRRGRALSIAIVVAALVLILMASGVDAATTKRVGIEAGHYPSSGALSCDKKINEKDINWAVANKTAEILRQRGYIVDVKPARSGISGYTADAFVALHTDWCSGKNTGFKVSRYGGAKGTGKKGNGDASDRLVDSLWSEYGAATGLPQDTSTVHFTDNMTYYYALNPIGGIAESTPGAIIEMGWLSGDFAILTSTDGQQKMATGIANAVDQFLGSSPTPIFSASGRITKSDGSGISGVTMTFTKVSGSGTLPVSVQTDTNGNWVQSDFQSGTIYRVAPGKSGYTFTPSSLDFNSANTELGFTSGTMDKSPKQSDGGNIWIRIITKAIEVFNEYIRIPEARSAQTTPTITPIPTPVPTYTPTPIFTPTVLPILAPTQTQTTTPTLTPVITLTSTPLISVYPDAQWKPAQSNNFYVSNREAQSIQYIVIHAMYGSLGGTISWFQNPTSQLSSHYLIGRGGEVVQMVKEKDIAYHAGNEIYNQNSIGIEQEDNQKYLTQPWATEEMYQASAKLVRYLTQKYNIPRDRVHIIGHNEVPGSSKKDPGQYWDWNYFMSLVNGQSTPTNPILSVSPTSGQQGTTFYYSGNQYTPNGIVEWHVRKPDGVEYPPADITGKVDGSGNFNHNYVRSCGNMVGTYTLWAFDKSTGKRSNDATQTITTSASCVTPTPTPTSTPTPTPTPIPNPTLSVSPTSGQQGTTFYYNGNQYTPSGILEWHVRKPDGVEYPPADLTGRVDGSGNFNYNYVSSCGNMVGTYTLWAFDKSTGKRSNDATETITTSASCVTPTPAPQITSISPTQTVASIFDLTINGNNFDSGAIDQIYWKADGRYVGTGIIQSRTGTKIVSRESMTGIAPGVYVVKVKNSDGQLSNGMDLTITAPTTPVPTPTLSVSPTSGQQGTTFYYSGNQYTPNGIVEWHVRKPDGVEYPPADLTGRVDGSGNFNHNYVSHCESMVGTYTLWAFDKSTGRRSNDVPQTIIASASCVSAQYQAHFANTGWMSNWAQDGQTVGTPGGNQMEAIKIKTTKYGIRYSDHVANDGWLPWVYDGAVAGTTGQGKSLQAIKIELQNSPSNLHVYYRVYVHGQGWQGWVSDGAQAGTTGQALAVEAIEIKIQS